MIRLATILALATPLLAQAPIELVQMDARTWTVAQVWLEPPVVTKTASFFRVTNPSFTRSSYVEIHSQSIDVRPKVGDEPDARLRVVYSANANIDKLEAVWFAVHDTASGARLGIRQLSVLTERASILTAVPKGDPPLVPPVTHVRARWTVRLLPRQSWTCTSLEAQRTWGPSIRYEAASGKVETKIVSSNFGGNELGALWSPLKLTTALPIAGFRGCGLWVDASLGVFFPYPLAPILSTDRALIGVVRSGSWQALETFAVPALGWPMGG